MRVLKHLVAVILIVGLVGPVFGQQSAPPNIAAALTMKVVKYERDISGGGDISIYVLGNSDVQSQLSQLVGQKIGAATLQTVDGGDALPGASPSILFVGSNSQLDAAIQYTREQKILSVTHVPDMVAQGVTLGLGVGSDGKPRILINLSSSSEEDLNWNADIMKVAQTIK